MKKESIGFVWLILEIILGMILVWLGMDDRQAPFVWIIAALMIVMIFLVLAYEHIANQQEELKQLLLKMNESGKKGSNNPSISVVLVGLYF